MDYEFLKAIALSLLLGSLIGIERQWHRRLVDLKTNALVCLGACLFLLVTKTSEGFTEPVRMAAQIVVGVGFIGGGLLYRDGAQTKGINTAATLWCCAAVGTLCGLGRWAEASIASLVIVLANTLLRQVAHLLNLKMGVNDSLAANIQFELTCMKEDASLVRHGAESIFQDAGADIREVQQKLGVNSQVTISIRVSIEHGDPLALRESLMNRMNALNINSLSWSQTS